MNTKDREYRNLGNLKRPDLLRFIAREMLLGDMISKTVAEALEEFLIDRQIEARSTATISFYRQFLKSFLEFVSPDTQVKDLTTPQLRDYFLGMNPAHVHAQHCRYRALRAYLNWCIGQNYLVSSPLTFSPPRLPDVTIPAFTDGEIKRMLKACDEGSTKLRDRAIILLLVDTGVRLGELDRMKLEDVDVQGRLLEIRGKGNKRRMLKMSVPTLKALWTYLRSTGGRTSDSLWLTEERSPLQLTGFKQAIRRIIKRAEITGHKASPHVFRHTFANNFLDSGAGDLLDLQYLLGHSSLAMVECYSRAHKQRRALKAQERLSQVDRLGLK